MILYWRLLLPHWSKWWSDKAEPCKFLHPQLLWNCLSCPQGAWHLLEAILTQPLSMVQCLGGAAVLPGPSGARGQQDYTQRCLQGWWSIHRATPSGAKESWVLNLGACMYRQSTLDPLSPLPYPTYFVVRTQEVCLSSFTEIMDI